MTEPTVICPNGHENAPGGRFCETCGAALTPATPPSMPTSGTSEPAKSGGLSPRVIYSLAAFVAIAAAVATGGAILLFSGGGGDDDAASPDPSPTAAATATAGTAATDTPAPTATPTPLPGATRENPLPVGVEKRGFDGWEVFVVRSDFDVVQEVMAENPNNEPPKDGYTFVLVRLNATNREAAPDEGETTTEFQTYTYALVDAEGVEYHTFDDQRCGVIPDGFAFLDNPQPSGRNDRGQHLLPGSARHHGRRGVVRRRLEHLVRTALGREVRRYRLRGRRPAELLLEGR